MQQPGSGDGMASLSLVLRHAPVILFATDMDGRITLSDGQGLTALGLRPHELVGQSVWNRAEWWGDVADLVTRAFAGEVVSGTYLRFGRHYHVLIQPLQSDDGAQLGITGVATDITTQVLATRHAETLLRLSELLDGAHAHPTLSDTLSAALQALTVVMPLDFLILWEPHDREYRARAWYGALPDATLEDARQGVTGDAALHWAGPATAVYWSDGDVPPTLRAQGIAAVAALPLPGGAPDMPGVLCAYRLQDGAPWSDQERTILQAAARSIAVLQARRHQLQVLEEAAFTDALTQLPNRRAFDLDLEAALGQSANHGVPLGVLITDIDGLKAVNDAHGHDRGDDLLRTFARALRGVLRDSGHCYRLGGDEFAALLPTVTAASVPLILARLDRTVELLQHAGFTGVRASSGIAVSPEDAGTGRELLHLADQRMYRIKAAHRSQADRSEPHDT